MKNAIFHFAFSPRYRCERTLIFEGSIAQLNWGLSNETMVYLSPSKGDISRRFRSFLWNCHMSTAGVLWLASYNLRDDKNWLGLSSFLLSLQSSSSPRLSRQKLLIWSLLRDLLRPPHFGGSAMAKLHWRQCCLKNMWENSLYM